MEIEIEIPVEHERNIFGSFDAYMKKIEKSLNVLIVARDSTIKLIGMEPDVKCAEGVLKELLELSKRGNIITEQNVDYTLSYALEGRQFDLLSIDEDIICHTIQGKPIKPKTAGQKKYLFSGLSGSGSIGRVLPDTLQHAEAHAHTLAQADVRRQHRIGDELELEAAESHLFIICHTWRLHGRQRHFYLLVGMIADALEERQDIGRDDILKETDAVGERQQAVVLIHILLVERQVACETVALGRIVDGG